MKICACSSEVVTHWPFAGDFALEQRDQDAERAEQAGAEIGDRNADAHRALARQAGDRHQPAHALRDLVEARPVAIGAVLAEAGDAGEDDALVDLAQRRRSRCRAGPSRRGGNSPPPRRPSRPCAGRRRAPCGDLRSSVMLRLLRCRFWKSGPWRGPPGPSPFSRRGGVSILMTLAPQSASWRTQVGPERTRVRSRTVKRERAWEALGNGISTAPAGLLRPITAIWRPDIPRSKAPCPSGQMCCFDHFIHHLAE